MVNTLFNKRAVNLSKALLVAYFALFPFGQLTRIGVNLFSLPLAFNVSDIVSGLFIIPYLLGVKDKSPITKYYSNLLIYFAFSYLVSLFVFKDIRVLAGFFYLLRFGSYYFMSRVVSGLYIYKLLAKKSLIILLKYAFITTLFFAFYQYLFLPDLRPLKYLGWDDHLYRLTGAFLDPGFAGIILILGFLFFLIEFFQKKSSTLFVVLQTLFKNFFFRRCKNSIHINHVFFDVVKVSSDCFKFTYDSICFWHKYLFF